MTVGLRTSTIREDLHALLLAGGWAPSAFPAALIGRDNGSKLHRSFATRCPSQAYAGRQVVGVQSRSRIEVLCLLSTQHDAPASLLDVDDAADELTALLLDASGDAWISVLESRTVALHATVPRIYVVTVTITALHHLYTSGA